MYVKCIFTKSKFKEKLPALPFHAPLLWLALIFFVNSFWPVENRVFSFALLWFGMKIKGRDLLLEFSLGLKRYISACNEKKPWSVRSYIVPSSIQKDSILTCKITCFYCIFDTMLTFAGWDLSLLKNRFGELNWIPYWSWISRGVGRTGLILTFSEK